PVELRPGRPDVDRKGRYLIVGGLGGFGAARARHLADLGVRNLALVGRRGSASPEAPALLAEMSARGVRATAYAADATEPEAMARVIAQIDAGPRPLRGVVHSALHLEDDELAELSDERFAAAFAAKAGVGRV